MILAVRSITAVDLSFLAYLRSLLASALTFLAAALPGFAFALLSCFCFFFSAAVKDVFFSTFFLGGMMN